MSTGFGPDISAAIIMRDGGMCAMLGAPGCPGHQADEANHRLNRGMGGTSVALVNSPANGCATEHHCNWALEAVPDFAEEARRRGVKLEQSADPLAVPMWSPFFRQWVRFTSETVMHLTGVTDPTLDAREYEEWTS